MFGHKQESLIGKELLIIMAPIYAKNHRSYISRLLETGKEIVLNECRSVFGFHMNEYIIPLILYAAASPNLHFGYS